MKRTAHLCYILINWQLYSFNGYHWTIWCVLCSRFVTSMSNLKQVFDKAAEHVKTLSSVSQDDQKYLYGRFKQAKVGDCNTGKPGILNPKERAKWEAWNSLKGMSADDAMRQYIAKVDSLAGSSFGSEVQ